MTTTGNEIAPYEGGQADIYRPQIMTPEAARELDRQLQACVNAVLREGTDYGPLPGTDGKSVLFKSGAEKLLQWFGLSYSCERLEIDRDADGQREGVTYRATVARRLPDGTLDIRATCDGYAGYDEDKFYQSAEQAQRKAEAKERHWAARDRRVANPEKWKHLTEYRAPWNTVIKMAQKRAMAGAVINATGGGGRFTVDDDSSDTPADGGPSNYQQTLAEVWDVTTREAANTLWQWVTERANEGNFTPGQKTHIQNCIKQRVKQIESYVQADVTTYADDVAATQDASPAPGNPPAGSASPNAEPASPVAGAAGEAPKSLLAAIRDEFTRIGIEDSSDRAIYVAKILLLDDVPGSLNKLTHAQRAQLHATLQLAADIDALEALVNDGEVAQDAAEGSEPA